MTTEKRDTILIPSAPSISLLEIEDALFKSITIGHSCKVLDSILAYLNQGGTWKHQERQNALGSTDGLIQNMLLMFKSQMADSKFCSKMFAILQIMCHFNNSDRYSGNLENIKKLGDAGACTLVVRALSRHTSEADLAKSGYKLGILKILQKYKRVDKWISLQILEFLYVPEKNIEIVHLGCDIIRILALCNTVNTDALIKAGALEALIGAVRVHVESSKVAIEGCEAIWDLAEGKDEVRARLGELGVCEVTTAALKCHVNDRDVVPYVCGAINHLAANNVENRKRLRDAGVCEVLMAAIRGVGADVNTILISCEAIKSLSTADNENADRLRLAGACTAMTDILRTHLDDSGVVSVVFDAIKALTIPNRANRLALGTVETCELITSALHSHRNNFAVTEMGCSVLNPLLLGFTENTAAISERESEEILFKPCQ